MLAIIALLACLRTALAASGDNTRWITYQNTDGTTEYLDDNRRPALYTGNFGDCKGDSLVNVTRFDAAYYKDNMTVLFHLEGNTGLASEALMMYIGVFAYGESRFDLTFNPCDANIASLCPMNSTVPISANGIIPIAESDVASIPPIALTIPDFEGEAILRIFANSTESEIGCYSAVVTNGNSFSQPASVGTVLGIFTFVAMLASFATAIYGEAVPTMRLHYAHSLSVGVIFAVFQHIYFTGALSVNWPSVLVAWWSNFAWAGGMIYSASMQHSIDHLIGNNIGNTSAVGAAQSGSTQENLGGGYDISQIYKRAINLGLRRMNAGKALNHPVMRDVASEIYGRANSFQLRSDLLTRRAEQALQYRDTIANASTGYKWYGHPVGPGLPLPGNYSGFAGTLAQEQIRASNAFTTGFLWFLILIVLLVAATMAFKWALEGFARVKFIKQDRLAYFRQHWLGYSASVALRTFLLAWFMMMFLIIFQFTYSSSGGVKAVAAIVFIIFLVGLPALAAYAVWYKLQLNKHGEGAETFQLEQRKLLGKIPWFGVKKPHHETGQEQQASEDETKSSAKPFWKRMSSQHSITASELGRSIHDDEQYTKRFGWLTARFRRTRWWFFTFWLLYEFIRACFYGGASGHPLTQVFGLLVVEILAFAFIVWARPFEGRRLNVLVVYCLGFSKVASVALSAAFDVRFNLQRITTTVIGIVIIVIQGILTIITLIAIVVGAITSYMSVSRNREDFRPRKWHGLREKYFNHLDRVVNDLPPEPKPAPAAPEPEEPQSPYFEMKNIRRVNKIEDDDPDPVLLQDSTIASNPNMSYTSLGQDHTESSKAPLIREGAASGAATPVKRSRAPSRASAASMSTSNLPFGARPHRPSWSQRDFTGSWADSGAEQTFTPVDMTRDIADDEPVVGPSPAKGARTPSRSATLPNPKLREAPSTDSLRIGGDVSTRDTIGKVPAPRVRPRAGTASSRSSWRGDGFDTSELSLPTSNRASRQVLTPAQEMEEWTARGSESQDNQR